MKNGGFSSVELPSWSSPWPGPLAAVQTAQSSGIDLLPCWHSLPTPLLVSGPFQSRPLGTWLCAPSFYRLPGAPAHRGLHLSTSDASKLWLLCTVTEQKRRRLSFWCVVQWDVFVIIEKKHCDAVKVNDKAQVKNSVISSKHHFYVKA